MIDSERKIGYIALLSFSRETPEEFDRAFEFLRGRGMEALVLDLRKNYGGVLKSAVDIAKRFIPSGVIVSTEGRGEPEVFYGDASEAWYEGFKLVVLVDGDSASASEVLAGAVQDYRVGVVIGSPTYGKGMVQTVRRFRDRRTVARVTSSYYYSPTHRNFERTVEPGRDYGIQPDLSIPIAPSVRRSIHAGLERYSPPIEAIPEIEAWEAQEGLSLIPPSPEDPQLAGALALFSGERPGPYQPTGQQ